MALGIKSLPDSVFEKGDLLYLRYPENGTPYYYSKPTDESTSFALATSPDGYIGVIDDTDVEDVSEQMDKSGIIVWMLIKLHNGKLGYVVKDSGYVSKANPDYDYPKKKGTFDWSGVVNGITGISQAILNIFNSSRDQANPTGNTIGGNNLGGSGQSAGTWMQRNLLWIILIILFPLLLIIIFRKPKNQQPVYEQPAPVRGYRKPINR